jgi:hypothetical protein
MQLHAGLVGLQQIAQASQPVNCRFNSTNVATASMPLQRDKNGVVLPQDLPDVRISPQGLPQTLSTQAFMQQEGSTYYW